MDFLPFSRPRWTLARDSIFASNNPTTEWTRGVSSPVLSVSCVFSISTQGWAESEVIWRDFLPYVLRTIFQTDLISHRFCCICRWSSSIRLRRWFLFCISCRQPTGSITWYLRSAVFHCFSSIIFKNRYSPCSWSFPRFPSLHLFPSNQRNILEREHTLLAHLFSQESDLCCYSFFICSFYFAF